MNTTEILDGREIPTATGLDTILERLNALEPGSGLVLIAPHDPDELLRKLVDDFPMRFEFAPLQSGPTEWRVNVRRRPEESPRNVFSYLAWDHDRLDAILESARAGVESELWEDARGRIAEFREGLFRHIAIEENVLFPVFEDATGIREEGPTSVMRHEHADIKEAVEGMAASIDEQSTDGFERCHANLLGVLVEHNMKEENILYPATDRAVDDVARNRLVEALLLDGTAGGGAGH